MTFALTMALRPRTRRNQTPESSTPATVAAKQLTKLFRRDAPLSTIARYVDAVMNAHANGALETLALAISSHVELEDSNEVAAAVSRGSINAVVSQVSYAARRTFADMARSMKIDVVEERLEGSLEENDGACHFSVDNVQRPKLQVAPVAKRGGTFEKDDEDSFWEDDHEGRQ